MDQKAYFEELSICLNREGFTLLPEKEDLLPVEWNGAPLCWINESGGIQYRQENVDTSEMKTALSKVTDITCTIREYMTMMETAPPLKAVGLENGFRLLADFNGTVLAGKQTQYGVNFVTWDWDFYRTGLNYGHYHMEDYQGAKEVFVLRSGMLPKERLFTRERLVELYRAVHGFLHGEQPSCWEQEDQCKSLLAQIRTQVPDLDQKLTRGRDRPLNNPCKGGVGETSAAVCYARKASPTGKGVFSRHSYRPYAPECPRLTSAKPVCRRYERCRDCPYPHDGFLCWGRDGSCLRTVMRKINGQGDEK